MHKKTAPHIFIVVGGLGPTLTPEIYLEGCEYIDAVLSGEGEYVSVSLLERLPSIGSFLEKKCPGWFIGKMVKLYTVGQ